MDPVKKLAPPMLTLIGRRVLLFHLIAIALFYFNPGGLGEILFSIILLTSAFISVFAVMMSFLRHMASVRGVVDMHRRLRLRPLMLSLFGTFLALPLPVSTITGGSEVSDAMTQGVYIHVISSALFSYASITASVFMLLDPKGSNDFWRFL